MPNDPNKPNDENGSSESSEELFSDSLEFGLHAAYGRPLSSGGTADNNLDRVISNRYRLIEKIGEGGMGSVWMAQQLEPIKRLVAIKLIKPGMSSQGILARFAAEQQALAVLDHPNIAKILDAGIDEVGLPYFAMELIKGVPITRYCDEQRLGTRERLELFLPICQAIQHAHQKGLIHRDIKPSNILIARFDNVPVPKVIDFGVAKAIGPLLQEGTAQTGFNAIVGTLEYMSPEQASFNNRDIDTRADIYALGAVLYELLVGSPPFHRQELTRLAVDEVLKVIRESEPPTPSQKLSSAERRASIAAERNSEPARLVRVLRNDLDWIVMKALEKERARRYDSSSALGDDIQRFLLGEAVEAAPPSRIYRLLKWYRRHRGTALAGGLILTSLLAGIIGTTWGYFYATEQQGIAEEKAGDAIRASDLAVKNEKLAKAAALDTKAFADHLVRDFLQIARPEGWNGGRGIDVTVREALLEADAKATDTFRDRPTAEAIARLSYAQTWHDLGEFVRAEANWRRVLELYQSNPELRDRPSDLKWLEPRIGLGHSLLKQSRFSEAKSEFERALHNTGQQELNIDTLIWLGNIGLAEIDLIELRPQLTLDRLLPILNEAEKDLTKHFDLVLQLSTLISAAYEAQRKMEEAVALNNRMLKLGEKELQQDHAYTIILRNAVAQNHWRLREYDEAIAKYRALVADSSRVFGPEHPTTLQIKVNLAVNLSDSGQFADAESMLTELRPKLIAKYGARHEKTLEARLHLGNSLLKQKKFDIAQNMLHELWQDSQQALGEDHAETVRILASYCDSLQQAGKLTEAIPVRETLLRLRRKPTDREDPNLLSTMNNLASLYWRTGQLDKSIPLFREVVAKCQAEYGIDDRRTLQASANLAVNLRDNEEVEAAIVLMEQVFEYSPKHSGLEWIADELILTYLAAGRLESARPLLIVQEQKLREALITAETQGDSKPLSVAHRQTALAENLVGQQRLSDAKPLLQSAIAIYEEQQPTGWQLASARSMLSEVLLNEAAAVKLDATLFASMMQEAESLMLAADERFANPVSGESVNTKRKAARKRLLRLYELWEKPNEVQRWQGKN